MKRARDVREQLLGLMERTEVCLWPLLQPASVPQLQCCMQDT